MNKYLASIREMVLESLKDESVKIILFGSRARKDNNNTSDVDIGIIPYGEWDERKIIFLKEKVEDLNVPYKIDIVNFSEVSKGFKNEALKGAVIWKD